MNKLFTISLAKNLYHIEKESYFLLNKYLVEVEENLKDIKEKKEILYDIELHISEILTKKIKENKFLEKKDIEEIIEIMGSPHSYQKDGTKEEDFDQKSKKKLFRNFEDKYLGGVCGGLAVYFDLKPRNVRLAFILLFLFPIKIILLLAYIIAWILLPFAKSTPEKLKMKGKKINLKSIKDSFNKKIILSRLKKKISKIFNKIELLIKWFFKSLKFFLGLFLLFIPTFIGVILFYYAINLIKNKSELDFLTHFYYVIKSFFTSSNFFYLNLIFGTIFLVSPFLLSLVEGLKLVFKPVVLVAKNISKYIFILWINATLILFISFLFLINEFNFQSTYKKIALIDIHNKNKILKIIKNKNIPSNIRASFPFFIKESNWIGFPINIIIKKSPKETTYLKINYSSRGVNLKKAAQNLKSISYLYKFNKEKNTLYLDEFGKINLNTPYRAQEILVEIFLAEDQKVFLENFYFYPDGLQMMDKHKLKPIEIL